MTGYYDRNGDPMELMEWARLVEDPAVKRVAYDSVAEMIRVSTCSG